MKNQFYFLLIPEKYEKHFVQMKAMHIMACIFLIVYAIFLMRDWDANWVEIISLIPASLAVVWTVIFRGDLLKQPQVNQVLRLFEVGFMALATTYFYKQSMWLPMILFAVVGLFIFLLLLVENKVFSEQFIELNTEGVTVPQLFYTKRIPWENIKSVVLKFQVITFELVDNNFVQQSVFHKYDEEELALFDDFLKRKLS